MGHGHRKSQSRAAAKGATPEVLTKARCDSDECGSKASEKKRREKRIHKRKRGHEDMFRKRHKERHRSSHHSSRSSKRRVKVSRLKGGASSETDSSSSSALSSKEAVRGRSSHHPIDRGSQKRIGSPITDLHKENRSKRMRIINEAFSSADGRENHDASIKPSRTEVHKCAGSKSRKARRKTKSISGSKSTRSERERDDMTITQREEQEMGLEGKKDRILEVELRQKALENFMRRRTDGHPSGTRQPARCNTQNVVEVDKRYPLDAGEAVSLDSSKVLNSHLPWNNEPIASTDEKCLAKGSDNNLEEGEIGSDTSVENETGNEIGSFVLDKGKGLHEKGNIEKSCDRDADHDLKISNEGELENVRTFVTAPSLSEMQEPSKGQALNDNSNVELTSAQRDSNDAFQEKTMSVMRGGEMVQVSYKVYIPKRAAELAARRRLQR